MRRERERRVESWVKSFVKLRVLGFRVYGGNSTASWGLRNGGLESHGVFGFVCCAESARDDASPRAVDSTRAALTTHSRVVSRDPRPTTQNAVHAWNPQRSSERRTRRSPERSSTTQP